MTIVPQGSTQGVFSWRTAWNMLYRTSGKTSSCERSSILMPAPWMGPRLASIICSGLLQYVRACGGNDGHEGRCPRARADEMESSLECLSQLNHSCSRRTTPSALIPLLDPGVSVGDTSNANQVGSAPSSGSAAALNCSKEDSNARVRGPDGSTSLETAAVGRGPSAAPSDVGADAMQHPSLRCIVLLKSRT